MIRARIPLVIALFFFLNFAGFVTAADLIKPGETDQKNKKDQDDKDFVSLQSFVVTGSNIKRLDMEKVVPVTVLSTDAIETRNALTPVDLLTSLPQVINLPENETRTGLSGSQKLGQEEC